MSWKTRWVESARYDLYLLPGPDSRPRIYEVNKGYQLCVDGVNGNGPRSVQIDIKKETGKLSQSATFTLTRKHIFELVIAKDVMKIPVTLTCDGKLKTIDWQAPFVKFPIQVDIKDDACYVVLPEDVKEATESKDNTQKDGAVSTSAVSTSAVNTGDVNTSTLNANSKESASQESLQSSASSSN